MQKFIQALENWAMEEAHIESIILAGSHARGAAREDSDVDLCILSAKKAKLAAQPDFARRFGQVCRMQTEYYGACTSIRVWYADGKEVEFGLVEPSWADRPLDEGTRRVLRDGYRVITDRARHFDGMDEELAGS